MIILPQTAKESGEVNFYRLESLDNVVFAKYTPQICVYSDFSKEGIVNYVRCRAIEAKINPNVVERVIKCESQFNPEAVGDGGCSRGIWQINTCVHKDITKKDAHDVLKSTDWAIPRFKTQPYIWSCY